MSREPPQPTDLNAPVGESDLDVCTYCLKLVDNEYDHYGECENRHNLTEIKVTGVFGIVVPEKSGYVWITKTDAFANRHVSIQGTYIPIGSVTSGIGSMRNEDFPIDLSKLGLKEFDNAQELRRIIEKGVRSSDKYDYGTYNLGKRLIEERVDGVYDDSEEVRKEKMASRDSRIRSVWEEINNELPFKYNRVAAPEGYPRTREGMRWIEITGHNYPDQVGEQNKHIFREPWVEALIDEDPVAFYYPNSD
jgi:hypothetical protein